VDFPSPLCTYAGAPFLHLTKQLLHMQKGGNTPSTTFYLRNPQILSLRFFRDMTHLSVQFFCQNVAGTVNVPVFFVAAHTNVVTCPRFLSSLATRACLRSVCVTIGAITVSHGDTWMFIKYTRDHVR